MSKFISSKKRLVEIIKRRLRKIAPHYPYPSELADCEESYKCLYKLNTTILIKIDICLTLLIIAYHLDNKELCGKEVNYES